MPGYPARRRLRMFATPIARVVEDRRRRPGGAEGRVVADIDRAPAVPSRPSPDGTRRMIPLQPFGGEDMRLDETPQRLERHTDGADRAGHGRQRDRRALKRIALGLAVQRLMLAELLEHDHREQLGPPIPARRHGRRRRLGDLLAVPAGELSRTVSITFH